MDHRDAANGSGYYPYAYRASGFRLLHDFQSWNFRPGGKMRGIAPQSPDSPLCFPICWAAIAEWYDCVVQNAPDDQPYLIVTTGLTELAGLPHETHAASASACAGPGFGPR